MQPINLILGATILGLLVAPFYVVSNVAAGCLIAITFFLWFLLRAYAAAFPVMVFCFFCVLANLRYPASFKHSEDIERLGSLTKNICWNSEVYSVASLPDGRRSIDVQLLNVENHVVLDKIGIRLYAESGEDKRILPGDIIHVCNRLRKPRLFGTPGEFHWPRYLQSQGIVLTSWIKNTNDIEIVGAEGHVVARALEAFRQEVGFFVGRHLTGIQAPLVRALVLGEGKLIPADIRKILGRSGVSHLFAISGLHVGLLSLYLYGCLLAAWKIFPLLADWQPPQRIIPVLIAPGMLAFLVLTGGALATQRACFVAIVGTLLLLRRYHVNALQLLASTATIFLLFDPLVLWDAGWQLSFTGAAAILYIGPLLKMLPSSRVAGWLARLFIVSLAATLATAPLVMADFHMFVPVGVLVNLIAVPMVTLVALPLGLLGLVSFPLSGSLSSLCFTMSGIVMEVLVRICQQVDRVSLLAGISVFPSRSQVLASVMVVLVLFYVINVRTRRQVCCCLLWLGIACIVWSLNELKPAGPAVTMLSVGQGEAILLQDGTGKAVLIDGGGLYSDTFDVGERLVAPALGMLGVRSLSAVVLTHNHPDHSKGLPFILNNFSAHAFYATDSAAQLSPSLASVLLSKKIPLVMPAPGWSHIVFGDSTVQLFSSISAGLSENDSSLVAFWPVGDDQGVLLTGDLEAFGVKSLLAASQRHAAILKLPHHGSKFSGSEALIQSVVPEICLVSAGYQNRYRLPARSLVEYIEKEEIQLLRTDLHGTVRVRFEKGHWRSERWESGLFR